VGTGRPQGVERGGEEQRRVRSANGAEVSVQSSSFPNPISHQSRRKGEANAAADCLGTA
jgi:hypothetical protein